MNAVGSVIQNRVGASGFPNTAHDVVSQKKQFEGFDRGAPTETELQNPKVKEAYDNCTDLAQKLVDKQDIQDNTGGATFYDAGRDSFSKLENQGKVEYNQQIGGHHFFNSTQG